jgi:HSP20 family molecular chaperone IbpA
MSRMSAFSSPFLLGFDEVERVLDRVTKGANEGYPPYNIERLAPEEGKLLDANGNGNGGDVLRITLAVAGFTRDQLDVTLEESQLVIRGRQVDDGTRHYLHRCIAARQFQRSFVLAEGIEILGAELKDGLLSIDLARPEPEKVIRKIDINSKD